MDADSGPEHAEEHGTYDVGAFAEELAAAATNLDVGTTRWFANEHVRVWEISLAPGERTPFHTHTTSYVWTVVEASRGRQRFADGTLAERDYRVGDTSHVAYAYDATMIHDLENVGDTPLRVVTIELLD